MSLVHLRFVGADIRTEFTDNNGRAQMKLVVDMTKEQRKDCFGELLAGVTAQELGQWVSDYMPEYVLKEEE